MLERHEIIYTVAGKGTGELLALQEALRDVKARWGAPASPSGKDGVGAQASCDLASLIDSSGIYTCIERGDFKSLEDLLSPKTEALLRLLERLSGKL